MTLQLQSARLTLNPLVMSDLALVTALFTSREVLRHVGGVMTPEAVRAEMPKWVRRGADGLIGVWCVSLTETKEKIGTVALLPMPIEEDDTNWDLLVPGQMPDAEIEIGYFYKSSAWGKGYATEACKRLLELAFERGALEEVVATYDEGNEESRNVLLKSGFVDHGTRISYAEEGPDFRLTRKDWLRLRNAPAAASQD